MSNQIKTSVIVCTRNRGNRVAQTIESVLSNHGAAFELILIDQSTNDETAVAINPFCADKRFQYLRSNTVGVGRSRNIGLRVSRGEIVLYTDDDCWTPENWVDAMTAIFDANQLVGMAFCNVHPAVYDQTAGFIPTYEVKQDFIARTIADKRHARGIGAGMGVRRSAALQVGGFDEMLGPGAIFPANEEGDLAVRMLFSGWHIYETSNVAVVHDGFRTWAQGKELTKRNWIGVGAAYSKPVKLRKWQFAPILFYEGFVNTFWQALAQIFELKRPKGFRSFLFFWYGFYLGLKVPIDLHKFVFLQKEFSG